MLDLEYMEMTNIMMRNKPIVLITLLTSIHIMPNLTKQSLVWAYTSTLGGGKNEYYLPSYGLYQNKWLAPSIE